MQKNHTLASPELAEVQLTYRSKQNPMTQPQIRDPQSAAEYFREIWDESSIELAEEFMLLLLNPTKRVLGWARIAKGSGVACIVDPAQVFKIALLANANSIIVGHNHPSGNLRLSSADKALTMKLVEAGKNLDINLDDHLILTRWDYTSFSQQGLL
ncbi:JAB domain-containing protein [Balneolaceae bacterium ANBcel3]|nr:JAB domain-containing protein [Balneolaceae bacterium ANBcel3]